MNDSRDSYARFSFSGLAADIGNLHRLQKSIGNQSLVRELCLTGREFRAAEAERAGFVSRVHKDKDR